MFLISFLFKTLNNEYVKSLQIYSKLYEENTKLMLHFLINDFTYLNDEMIEKLSNIKKYEELKEDNQKFSELSEEIKKLEEEKFVQNEKMAKSYINVKKNLSLVVKLIDRIRQINQ